ELTTQVRQAPLDLQDFHIAWYVVAALAAITVLFFARLPPDAGSNVSGHRAPGLPKVEAVA
ncbi:MAG TPA: MFS transporter, partial [Devosiaceae bacterium]